MPFEERAVGVGAAHESPGSHFDADPHRQLAERIGRLAQSPLQARDFRASRPCSDRGGQAREQFPAGPVQRVEKPLQFRASQKRGRHEDRFRCGLVAHEERGALGETLAMPVQQFARFNRLCGHVDAAVIEIGGRPHAVEHKLLDECSQFERHSPLDEVLLQQQIRQPVIERRDGEVVPFAGERAGQVADIGGDRLPEPGMLFQERMGVSLAAFVRTAGDCFGRVDGWSAIGAGEHAGMPGDTQAFGQKQAPLGRGNMLEHFEGEDAIELAIFEGKRFVGVNPDEARLVVGRQKDVAADHFDAGRVEKFGKQIEDVRADFQQAEGPGAHGGKQGRKPARGDGVALELIQVEPGQFGSDIDQQRFLALGQRLIPPHGGRPTGGCRRTLHVTASTVNILVQNPLRGGGL